MDTSNGALNVDPGIADPNYVDPNAQTEGFQASMLPIGQNPLGLSPAVSVQEGLDAPNGGLTFSSQHNAEVSRDAANLWTWEFDGYNCDTYGLTTMHNIKDPSWPVVYTFFETLNSPDFAPIDSGELNKTDLDALAQGLMDADGVELGYTDIFEAVNDTALAVVSRIAADPTKAIFGVFGNNVGTSDLNGGINMPVDDSTYIPLTPEEIATLPDPNALDAPSPAPAQRKLRKWGPW
ncbi:hypothetical protein ABPG77_009930 [Micractinium sp. CCAP 211/92]